jgi:hypothetical protein
MFDSKTNNISESNIILNNATRKLESFFRIFDMVDKYLSIVFAIWKTNELVSN